MFKLIKKICYSSTLKQNTRVADADNSRIIDGAKILGAFLLLQVSAEWEAIYVPNVKNFYCSINALSERPGVIENVTLDRLTIMQEQYRYEVEASWDRPDSFNGAFDKYEVAITDEVLAPDVDEPPGSANEVSVPEVGGKSSTLLVNTPPIPTPRFFRYGSVCNLPLPGKISQLHFFTGVLFSLQNTCIFCWGLLLLFFAAFFA